MGLWSAFSTPQNVDRQICRFDGQCRLHITSTARNATLQSTITSASRSTCVRKVHHARLHPISASASQQDEPAVPKKRGRKKKVVDGESEGIQASDAAPARRSRAKKADESDSAAGSSDTADAEPKPARRARTPKATTPAEADLTSGSDSDADMGTKPAVRTARRTRKTKATDAQPDAVEDQLKPKRKSRPRTPAEAPSAAAAAAAAVQLPVADTSSTAVASTDGVQAADGAMIVRDSNGLAVNRSGYRVFDLEHTEFLVASAAPTSDVLDLRDVYVYDKEAGVYARPLIEGPLPQGPTQFQAVPWQEVYLGDTLTDKPPREWVLRWYLVRVAQDEPNYLLDLETVYIMQDSDRSLRKGQVEVRGPVTEDMTLRVRADMLLLVPNDEAPDAETLNREYEEQMRTEEAVAAAAARAKLEAEFTINKAAGDESREVLAESTVAGGEAGLPDMIEEYFNDDLDIDDVDATDVPVIDLA